MVRGRLTGRTAIVTGAGAGLGRAEALALAREGADVVVNDLGQAADTVAAEITAAGGSAVAIQGDVGHWRLGDSLVTAAIDAFGGLDIVVNNAGVTRDGMLFNLTEQQWDDVLGVHLKGHAAVSGAAARYWRATSKATGEPCYGRVVNTASEAFLFGSAGQANYAAAKAGIVALTLATARGLARYGVKANAICPRARTAMTENVFADGPRPADGALDPLAPERVATFVTYLASPGAGDISGQVFVVYNDLVALLAAPSVEHTFTAGDGTFSLAELDARLSGYFADRNPGKTFAAAEISTLDNTGTG
ncbi:SDR family NAD(P)-dependent oxidoreductase [Saccharomonospora sp. NPDC006951]